MIYFKHKQTDLVYKAHTLREQLSDDGHYMFDAIIAHIVYGHIERINSENNLILEFLADYEILIPEYNVFGKVAEGILKTAI